MITLFLDKWPWRHSRSLHVCSFCLCWLIGYTLKMGDIGYHISGNSFRRNYSFLEVAVWQVFKGENYSREETINLLLFVCIHNLNTCHTPTSKKENYSLKYGTCCMSQLFLIFLFSQQFSIGNQALDCSWIFMKYILTYLKVLCFERGK